MSAGGQFGGSRGLAAKPPEKGVFPLDHFGECAEVDAGRNIGGHMLVFASLRSINYNIIPTTEQRCLSQMCCREQGQGGSMH